jgi:molybdopterin molybdotransferase
MLSVSEARARILASFQAVESLTVPLSHAFGRILALDITTGIDLPLFDNSSVDGFALHKADLASDRLLAVVADIRAGDNCERPLRPGECARIMTGSLLPPGADGVVKVEDTVFIERNSGTPAPRNVTLRRSIQVGENIRRRGDDIKCGEKALSTGTRLRAQEIGLLAMLGLSEVQVHRKPKLALLSSGDELVPVEKPLSPGKIHESNSYVLAALSENAGAELIQLGVAADTETDIRTRLEHAVGAGVDLIVSSAGVSVGAFDYVKQVIEQNGELAFWKVNMRPGKPLAFGRFHGVPFLGLPGNPVSAFVGFEVFVRPTLEKLSGLEVRPHPRQKAYLAEAIESDGRESYLRSTINQENGRLMARLTGHQGSGNIISLVRSNALLIVPSGVKSLPASSEVEIWPIE